MFSVNNKSMKIIRPSSRELLWKKKLFARRQMNKQHHPRAGECEKEKQLRRHVHNFIF
jgi:hypothetical protein